MAEQFNFKAPQFVESLGEFDNDENTDILFKNEDPSSSLIFKQDLHISTPKNSHFRLHSTSVVSRSGKRCHSSFRSSLHIKRREIFKPKINKQQENDVEFKFKARPAKVLKKEPFWPYRNSRNLPVGKAPALKTEERVIKRQLLKEKEIERDKFLDIEREEIKKIDEEELKKYRKTLEFKATAIKKC